MAFSRVTSVLNVAFAMLLSGNILVVVAGETVRKSSREKFIHTVEVDCSMVLQNITHRFSAPDIFLIEKSTSTYFNSVLQNQQQVKIDDVPLLVVAVKNQTLNEKHKSTRDKLLLYSSVSLVYVGSEEFVDFPELLTTETKLDDLFELLRDSGATGSEGIEKFSVAFSNRDFEESSPETRNGVYQLTNEVLTVNEGRSINGYLAVAVVTLATGLIATCVFLAWTKRSKKTLEFFDATLGNGIISTFYNQNAVGDASFSTDNENDEYVSRGKSPKNMVSPLRPEENFEMRQPDFTNDTSSNYDEDPGTPLSNISLSETTNASNISNSSEALGITSLNKLLHFPRTPQRKQNKENIYCVSDYT
mmetsp:Transcript_1824/g.2758  ORF Transcript_1824/g.2758 Transcript_1824/m.2758 type:complete len:361 (-) Transcript_1824:143-1225(-)|eukprot:CAMPEP_0195510388 /NCGR_PEP_ID=MMETSP0794_2-20130614/3043_1 /TAXON_ID=515487 /ORGANISM="Stephanopyxis turris, Strain CCMP 815" /LENGTH=360 /DNA_ID=CAMNT_0040637797 /DNA_START=174 /DNA_END=1256 /DNA_ORIENTATION=+